jgi:hypothetical protein
MFYNYSLAPYFILLAVGFVATLNGLMILKTRSFSAPFRSGERASEQAALIAGYALVTLGVASFLALAWMFAR